MSVEELFYYVSAESVAYSSIVVSPSRGFDVRVTPQNIAVETVDGNIRGSLDTPDLLKRLKLRRYSAVHANNFVTDNRGNRKAVPTVRECFPELDRISFFAVLVEAVSEVDAGAFMISSL